MKQLVFILTALLMTMSSCTDNEPSPGPNILLVMTDDQGYGDIGFYGNPYIKTPFLDSLARMSTRFNQFYVCPVCAPTRAGLMTGRYALRTGVYDTYNGGAIMHGSEVTVAEILKEAGYETAIFGKWHLGDGYPTRPVDQGFDVSLVHKGGGVGQPGDHFDNYMRPDSSYFNSTLLKSGIPVKTKGFCSDVYTDAAIEFVEKTSASGAPFFLYLPFNAPHTPLQVPGEYLDIYRDLSIMKEEFPDEGNYPDMNTRDHEDAKRVYAMVTNIDDNLKRLFDKIDQLQMLENTVIIFLTDNGPQQPRYVAGFNGRKGSVLEGGIRVPCFWYWKGNLSSDVEINDAAANFDMLPTLCDIAGIDLPAGLNLDGRSLVPLLKNETEKLPERTLFFEWQRGFPQPYRNIATRRGDYKMVGSIDYHEDPAGLKLYNIANDPYELNDISAEEPEILSNLRSEFDSWYGEVIKNENLVNPPRIIIGTEHENPVVLGRNDYKGGGAIRWAAADAFGYWDIAVARDGLYDVTLVYKENVKTEGRAFVRAGTIQRSIENRDTTTNIITLNDVPFLKGEHRFESWYQSRGMPYTPIYVEITSK